MTKGNGEPRKLPKGWIEVFLEEVSYQITDGTHKTPDYQKTGIRFISIKNLRPFQAINWASYERYITEVEHKQLIKRCKPEFNDVLFPRIGTLGFAKRIDFKDEVSIFVGLGLIKTIEKYVLPKYTEYYMNTPYINDISHKRANGTGRKTLPLEESRRFPFMLAPFSEQQRIVEKIEELFSDLDQGIENLKKAHKQLKIYRQVILKWAFEGKLTEKWRSQVQQEKLDLKTGEELLAQIKAERENRYQQQLAECGEAVREWEAIGKLSKKPNKPQKPKDLPPLTEGELSSLTQLPDSWYWIKIGDVSRIGTGVTPLKKMKEFYENGTIPWVTSGALNKAYVKKSSDFVTELALEKTNLKIYPIHTLVVALYGEGKTRGKCSELLIEAATNKAIAAIVQVGIEEEIRPYLKCFLQKKL